MTQERATFPEDFGMDPEGFRALGSGNSGFDDLASLEITEPLTKVLETFQTPKTPDHSVSVVQLGGFNDEKEFTSLCPMTGQPDFATVTITYVPDRKIVELKSLKLYLWSYRDEGAFHEDVTNRILDDLVGALSPRRLTVHTSWNVRGGINTDVTASHP